MLGVGRRGAVELAKTQIRVNTLAPGLTSTRLWDNSRELGAAAEGGFESQTEENRQAAAKEQTSNKPDKDYIKQTSTPDDIANVMLFLASDMSQAVNAEYIIVSVLSKRYSGLHQAEICYDSLATGRPRSAATRYHGLD